MRLKFLGPLGLGVVLTLGQLLLAYGMSPRPTQSIAEFYSRLCQWDCGWYEAIARDGYHSGEMAGAMASNVAFFPGYPYLGRTLHLSLGLKPRTGLLVIAQLFSVAFWASLWALLRQWRVPLGLSALAVLAVLAHPAAFFLVSGYSESMFLSALTFFVLCMQSRSIAARRSALIAGFAVSATRIVGVAAAGVPIMRELVRSFSARRIPAARELVPMLVASLAVASGMVLFLVYCHLWFGRYDIYLETQRLGWGILPDYGALWKWRSFNFIFPIDRIATQASGIAFLLLPVFEILFALRGRSTGFSRRAPLYATAFLIFYLTLSGLMSVGFRSMVRYTLPWFVLLTLCLSHLAASLLRMRGSRSVATFLNRGALVLIGAMLLSLLYFVQLPHLRDFLAGRWFA